MKSKSKILSLILLSAFLLVACSSGTSYTSKDSISESIDNSYDYGYSSSIESGSYYGSDKQVDTEVEQKIIVNVDLSIETKEFNKTIDSILAAVKKYNGYTQTSSIDDNYSYYSESSYRYGRFTLRIPAENLDAFLIDAENYGNVVSTETSTQDVTVDYYDREAQLEALRAQEQRLIEMYEKAETIDELIKLENRLSDLRYQIDSNETVIRNYNLLTKYSTVTIFVEEVKILAEVDESFLGELKVVILNSIEDFTQVLKELLFTIIYLLPYILLVGFIAVPLSTWLKATQHKREAKRAAKKQKQEEERRLIMERYQKNKTAAKKDSENQNK